LQNPLAHSAPSPHYGATNDSDKTQIGGRVAPLALAGALLIVFLTLFVVGLALDNRDASADAPHTLAPEFSSATALLTVAAADILADSHRHTSQRWREGEAYRDADSYGDVNSTNASSPNLHANISSGGG
jgi:hypothetical protein